MYSYTVHKNGVPVGPLTESEVREKLAAGEFAATDLSWRPGLTGWSPLGTRLAEDDGSAPPPLPAAGAPAVAEPKKGVPVALIVGGVALCGFIMLVVIGILAALAIPALTKARNSAIEKSMRNDARIISSSWTQSCAEAGKESATLGTVRKFAPTLSNGNRLGVETALDEIRFVDFGGRDDALVLTKCEHIVITNPKYKRALSSNRSVAAQTLTPVDGILFDLETGAVTE